MSPKRIQLRRAKGWRLPAGAVNCARPGPWGNPFRVGRDGTAAECVEAHRALLEDAAMTEDVSVGWAEQTAYRHRVLSHMLVLRGRDLACWCRPGRPCHADTLLRLANGKARGE